MATSSQAGVTVRAALNTRRLPMARLGSAGEASAERWEPALFGAAKQRDDRKRQDLKVERERLLALTLGIYLNTLTGRPPRALAAYDGR